MGPSRRFRQRIVHGDALFLLPAIQEAMSPELRNALAIRNAATMSGRCACAAVLEIHMTAGGLAHLVFNHEPGCQASDESIWQLSEQDS